MTDLAYPHITFNDSIIGPDPEIKPWRDNTFPSATNLSYAWAATQRSSDLVRFTGNSFPAAITLEYAWYNNGKLTTFSRFNSTSKD
jgi:hypothetical protein